MDALAVVLEQPGQLALQRLPLSAANEDCVSVDIEWTAISTGTERSSLKDACHRFGMGYPLVPASEAVGRVRTDGFWLSARASGCSCLALPDVLATCAVSLAQQRLISSCPRNAH